MSKKIRIKSSKYSVNFKKDDFFEDSLSDKVKKIIKKIPGRNITLSEIVNLFGNDGLLLFAAFLSIIFLIPVSIPGFSTVFGSILFFIGLSYLINRSLWLPDKIKNKTLSTEKLCSSLNKGLKWLRFVEKISKPHRFNSLTNNKISSTINGLMILLGAAFLMLPFGIMPFSNTLPALVILFLSIGIIQKDGIIILLGYFSVLGTFIYFGFFFSTLFLAFKNFFSTIAQ